VFTPLAQPTPFDITVTNSAFFNPPRTLTLSGAGITNNSGVIQNFSVDIIPFGEGGTIVFENQATAGEMTAFTGFGNSSAPPFLVFNASSTTGGATINNNSAFTEFNAMSNAANATINNSAGGLLTGSFLGGVLDFNDNSSAGNATINNATPPFNQGGDFGTGAGRTFFSDNSTASSATITADGAKYEFAHELDGPGVIEFNGTSTAGNATLIANGGTNGGGGGWILFEDDSTGGTARVELFGNGTLDIGFHNAPGTTIGSIEGTGLVSLGLGNLTVGSNNLSTVFSGVIQSGFSGTGGSLTKIGTGTLVLSGANTYTGNTTISGGVLQVNGSIASPNTFVNRGGTLRGTGTVGGNLNNNGVVAPGDSPGTLHVGGNYSQGSDGTLEIEIASLFSFDQLMISGTAALSGTLDVTLDDYTGHAGDIFTILTSSGLSGNFSILDLPTLSNGLFFTERVTSNDVLLTVNGPANVPDPGATLLLMAGALAALFSLQRFWRRTKERV